MDKDLDLVLVRDFVKQWEWHEMSNEKGLLTEQGVCHCHWYKKQGKKLANLLRKEGWKP